MHLNRKCKDTLFLLLFAGFLLMMCGLIAFGFIKGDPQKLIAPYDGQGNFCGHTKGFEDHQWLYLTNLDSKNADEIFASGICLKQCPPKSNMEYNFTAEQSPSLNQEKDNIRTVKSVYQSKEALFYCFPDFEKDPDNPFTENWKNALERWPKSSWGKLYGHVFLSRCNLNIDVGSTNLHYVLHPLAQLYCALNSMGTHYVCVSWSIRNVLLVIGRLRKKQIESQVQSRCTSKQHFRTFLSNCIFPCCNGLHDPHLLWAQAINNGGCYR